MSGSNLKWIYLIALAPTLTEYLEGFRLPHSPRELITDVVLTILLLGFARVVCQQDRRLRELVITDELTGVGNRRKLERDLPLEVERARRFNTPLALAYADIDRFKRINDTFGHHEGDKVIMRVAEHLNRSIRGQVDSCYRIGGDEFVLTLPGATADAAVDALQRILANPAYDETGLASYGTRLSTGVVELEANESWKDLLRRADECMYSMKSAQNGSTDIARSAD